MDYTKLQMYRVKAYDICGFVNYSFRVAAVDNESAVEKVTNHLRKEKVISRIGDVVARPAGHVEFWQ